jgi:hypothetical protein
MPNARSRVTAQRQVSVPDVRRKPGIGSGGDAMVVRRVGRFSSEDIHRALFGAHTPEKRSLAELKEGIPRYARKRYARRAALLN